MARWTSFRSLVLVSLCIAVNTMILRLPCTIYADFEICIGGKKLTSSVLRRDRGLDDIRCMTRCVEHPKCRSYNINVEESICELNSKAKSDNGTELVSKQGWIYKSTDNRNQLVGITCKEMKPCKPGVLCQDTCEPPYYKCLTCDKNHSGLHCDKKIDRNECENNPCLNSGTCIDMFAEYRCNCTDGYTGKNCEIDIDECSSLPCFNGATCIESVNSYQCSCVPGYTGKNCEIDLGCSIVKCSNGSNCEKIYGKYICLQNVAKSKVTSQSSTKYNGVSSRAVDGIKNGMYYDLSCSHTSEHDNKPWWQVDLGAIYSVYSLNITNRSDAASGRLRDFNINIDDKLCKYVSGTLNAGETHIKCASMVEGQIVKIQLRRRDALTLCEVDVYALP